MNLETILEEMDRVRERLLVAIAPLPDEALLRPGADGAWSVRDVLAHLVNWEAELVTGLMRIDQGKKPERLLAALSGRDAYNAARAKETKERDLDRVFDDLQGVRVQLEGWLEEFSNRDLTDRKRYRWLKGKPLWRVIAGASYAHEAEHVPALERFAAQWQAERAEDDDG